jgi:hypothetical protein
MKTIGEYIYSGMGAASTVLGFLFVIVGAAVALFLIVYGVLLIAQAGEKAGRKGVRQRGRAQAYGNQPYGHAPAMGKHVRKGL